MAELNPCVLSIAGFDPSGGAGILADIKTFEAFGITGMGVVTAVTFQNDICFEGLKWMDWESISRQLNILKKRFEFSVIKIGLIENLEVLERVVLHVLKLWPAAQIIWDPIVKASAGFLFHSHFQKEQLVTLLRKCFLITPNTDEVVFLAGINNSLEAADRLNEYCAVLLKGGHNQSEPGVDYLFVQDRAERILPSTKEIFPKHGSGCILSSAVTAGLASGNDLSTSCHHAKKYIERYLSGSKALLGRHYAN